MLSNNKREKIALAVIGTLVSRFGSFPSSSANNRNAPFHEAFLNAFTDKFYGKVSDIPFFISLSSWLHGLNTTMGQSFFENVAHILSDGEKKDFTSTRNTLLTVKPAQKESIAEIITSLKNHEHNPDLSRESDLIFIKNDESDIDANSFTVDVYTETETEIIAYELKSVKPNAGEMRGEKQKILEAKAALYNKNPHKVINFYIGFPFDPTSDISIGFDKDRFIEYPVDLKKYFALDEFLIAEELWNHLSGDTNTMQQILDLINAVAQPDFLDRVSFINNHDNRDKPEYLELLKSWHLYKEIELIENEEKILKNISRNKIGQKRYYQDVIKPKGEYNEARYTELVGQLS